MVLAFSSFLILYVPIKYVLWVKCKVNNRRVISCVDICGFQLVVIRLSQKHQRVVHTILQITFWWVWIFGKQKILNSWTYGKGFQYVYEWGQHQVTNEWWVVGGITNLGYSSVINWLNVTSHIQNSVFVPGISIILAGIDTIEQDGTSTFVTVHNWGPCRCASIELTRKVEPLCRNMYLSSV